MTRAPRAGDNVWIWIILCGRRDKCLLLQRGLNVHEGAQETKDKGGCMPKTQCHIYLVKLLACYPEHTQSPYACKITLQYPLYSILKVLKYGGNALCRGLGTLPPFSQT